MLPRKSGENRLFIPTDTICLSHIAGEVTCLIFKVIDFIFCRERSNKFLDEQAQDGSRMTMTVKNIAMHASRSGWKS